MGSNKNTTMTKQQQLQIRKEPLLGESIRPNVGTNETNRGDCCARILFASMPIISCTFILAFLYLLIYKGGFKPAENLMSKAIAEYEPQQEIIVVSIVGATFGILTTLARDVQIGVYFSREGTYTSCLKAANSIGALANTLSYVGFLVLLFNKYEAEDETEDLLHDVGGYMFFGLGIFYAILQSALLCKQTQYSLFIKIVFVLMTVSETAVGIGFLVLRARGIQLQWFTVALISLYTGLFSVLFLIDPVDDELKEFFFFGCCRRMNINSPGKDRPSVNNGRAAIELA
jgi:hypothetical protein